MNRHTPPWHRTLTARIIAFNMLGFLLTCLALFTVLDHFQHSSLLARTDTELEDELLILTAEWGGGAQDAGVAAADIERLSRARGITLGFYRLLDPEGNQLVASDLSYWPGVAEHRPPAEESARNPILWRTHVFGDTHARVMDYRFPDGHMLEIGHDLSDMERLLWQTRRLMAVSILLVLLLAGGFSWFFTYKGLAGIRLVGQTAALIRRHGRLEHRVPAATGSAETDLVALTFNEMLDHLQKLMTNLRYVMDNIAHDIKTPVTRMRGLAETELLKPDCGDPVLPGRVVEECDLILNLVNILLQITAAESGIYQWQLSRLDLVELVREGCDLFEPLFEEHGLTLALELPERLELETDGRVLQRVVANLVDNAIKYNRTGGMVRVSLQAEDAGAVLRISDTGMGIKPEDQALVFDRFYRTDRSRSKPGNGLGLSFCKAALEGMGGTIACDSVPDRGTTFTVHLPPEPRTGTGKRRAPT